MAQVFITVCYDYLKDPTNINWIYHHLDKQEAMTAFVEEAEKIDSPLMVLYEVDVEDELADMTEAQVDDYIADLAFELDPVDPDLVVMTHEK